MAFIANDRQQLSLNHNTNFLTQRLEIRYGKNNGKEKRARELFAKEVQEEKANKGWKYNRNLLEASLDPLITIGLDGIITGVNSATEKATGLPREKDNRRGLFRMLCRA